MDSNKQNDTGVHLSPEGVAWQNKDISSKYLAEIFGQEFFGDWTVNKFKYVNKICEIPASDWNSAGYSYSKVQYGRFKYYAIMVRNALQAAADAGTPVLDDDGSYMQLSPAYEVDYSAYH